MGAAIAVIALAIGVGGSWFFLGHKGGGDEHAQAKAKSKPAAEPLFVTLEPFVVNLAGDVQHFLQVGIDLRVADNSVSDQIKVHLPEIRNGVVLLLSSKKVEDLTEIDQKNRLRAELREVVNKPLGISTPPAKAAAAPAAGGEAPQAVGEAHAAEPAKRAEAEAAPDSGVLEVLLTSFVIQ
jgi:flagellar FliL protein